MTAMTPSLARCFLVEIWRLCHILNNGMCRLYMPGFGRKEFVCGVCVCLCMCGVYMCDVYMCDVYV